MDEEVENRLEVVVSRVCSGTRTMIVWDEKECIHRGLHAVGINMKLKNRNRNGSWKGKESVSIERMFFTYSLALFFVKG